MAPADGPMAVRRLSRLPPSSLVKRGSNTKLLVHASVSSLATEPFASPTPPPWDVVIIREKDNPEGKDHLVDKHPSRSTMKLVLSVGGDGEGRRLEARKEHTASTRLSNASADVFVF